MSRKKWIWIVIASVWLFAVFYGLLKTTGVIALTAKHSEIDPELLSLWGLDSSDQEHAFQEQTTYASSFQVPQITSPPVIRSAEQLIPEGTWHLVYAFFRGDSTRHSYDYGDRIIAVESDSRHGVITSSADTDALRFVVENRNGVDVMASYEWSLYEYVIEGDLCSFMILTGTISTIRAIRISTPNGMVEALTSPLRQTQRRSRDCGRGCTTSLGMMTSSRAIKFAISRCF